MRSLAIVAGEMRVRLGDVGGRARGLGRRPPILLWHGQELERGLREFLVVPEEYRWAPPQVPGPSTNVAQAYARFARDYRGGTHLCPTFEDAVTRHRMLDAIETAAATGQRQTLG